MSSFPVYNYGRFLEACITSVLNQSVVDLRILIIDDASTDDTISVARKLARDDHRVSVIAHEHNCGHIETYNEGIKWATADYFLLLSADDLLVDGALQRAVDVMDENPDVVLTYGNCVTWFDDLPAPTIDCTTTYSWTRRDLIAEICAKAENIVPTPTAIARTSVQKAIGGYRKSLPHAGDMEMWLRFAASGSVAYIDTVQAIYRKHTTAMSNAYFAEILSDYRQRQLAFGSFFDMYGDRLGNSSALRDVARRMLAREAFRHGIGLLRRGQIKVGSQSIRYAMDMDRRLRYFPPFWQILRIPGPAGRNWAKSALMGAVARSLNHKRGAI